jgi:hypothetical protein
VDRELTYRMPFNRLRKLGRQSGRKAHPALWWARWLLLGSFFVLLIATGQFEETIQSWGLPPLAALVALIVVYAVAILLLRRFALRQTQSRTNFDADVRLRCDDNGIRIASDQIEYYLKWPGISQMFMEHDGVVVSHGQLFFLVPDIAFKDADERISFIRDVFSRLGDEARSRSETSIRPVLDAAAAATRG